MSRSSTTSRRRWAALLAFLGAYAAWQIAGWGGAGARPLVGDASFVPINVAAILAALGAARRSAGAPRLVRGWRLVAAGLACYLLGDLVQGVYEVGLASAPYPSAADVAYLGFYPLVLTGLLTMPGRHAPRASQVLLDCATVAPGGAAVLWALVAGPAVMDGTQSAVQVAFSLAYPAGDLVLLVGLAWATERAPGALGRTTGRWLTVALLLYVAADVVYGYVSLHGGYAGGDPLDAL